MFVLEGRQLRASARSISLPGLYVMTRFTAADGGASSGGMPVATVRFFRLIILRGLWSVSMMNVLPYRYIMELSTQRIYDGQELSLDVGITGLSVCEGLVGKSYGLSVLDDAGFQPLE